MTSSQSPELTSRADVEDTRTSPEPAARSTGGTTDMMTRILLANELEQAGEHAEAIAKYQQVVDEDQEGVYGSIAQKALEDLKPGRSASAVRPMTMPEMPIPIPAEDPTPEPVILSSDRPQIAIVQWFYDLSIRNKQLVFLGIFELLVLILVGAGAWLINQSLRNQLVTQAQSELTVAENTYTNRLAQLGAIAQTEALSQEVISAARGVTPEALQNRLRDLTREAQLEYAALVNADLQIQVAAKATPGQTFDPEGLVSEVLADPRQIRATVVVDRTELPTELGEEGEQLLMRFVVSPLVDPNSQAILGALVLGNLVSQDQQLMEEILQIFGTPAAESGEPTFGGYSAIYFNGDEGPQLAVGAEQADGPPQPNVALPQVARTRSLLNAALDDPLRQPQTARLQIGTRSYTMAAKALPNQIDAVEMGEGTEVATERPPVAVLVRGTPEVALDQVLFETLTSLVVVAVVVVILHILLALFLGRSITQPLQRLGEVARAFSLGDRQQRAEVITQDEVGELAQTFNEMADNILASEAALEEQAQSRQQETQQQIQLRENLQQGVVDLLLEIEGAQHGDLTVQAHVSEGEVGSIADAFNTTLRSLRQLVAQVKGVANRVNQLAHSCEVTADQLSPNALAQAAELNRALQVVEENAISIQRVAQSAQEAAEIARRGSELVKVGDRAIDQTVASMEKIRISAGGAAKQVKRLAESSQEISQIVGIITGIADKTNLLAFNASLEAARAGEHGQGFRQIADEVRRLATQVNDFAQEIEGLVGGIQLDTAEVIRGMEQNTSEVVTGTQWVNQTRATLQELVAINEHIDTSLKSVTEDTVAQTQASQQVTQTIAVVANGAQSTSRDAQGIVTSLRELVQELQALRRSVARFQVNPEDDTEIPEVNGSLQSAQERARANQG